MANQWSIFDSRPSQVALKLPNNGDSSQICSKNLLKFVFILNRQKNVVFRYFQITVFWCSDPHCALKINFKISKNFHFSRHPPILEAVSRPQNKICSFLISIKISTSSCKICLFGQFVDHLSKLFCRPFLYFHWTNSLNKFENEVSHFQLIYLELYCVCLNTRKGLEKNKEKWCKLKKTETAWSQNKWSGRGNY